MRLECAGALAVLLRSGSRLDPLLLPRSLIVLVSDDGALSITVYHDRSAKLQRLAS